MCFLLLLQNHAIPSLIKSHRAAVEYSIALFGARGCVEEKNIEIVHNAMQDAFHGSFPLYSPFLLFYLLLEESGLITCFLFPSFESLHATEYYSGRFDAVKRMCGAYCIGDPALYYGQITI